MAKHRCPIWVGHLLASPLRRLQVNPHRLLRPYVREGMTALDIGCAMGFFSLPLAQMVGAGGKVVCVDVQEKMIATLRRRAERSALIDRIDARICGSAALGIDDLLERIDFALGFAVVHEVAEPARLFGEVRRGLKDGALFLMAEPKAHVSAPDFRATVAQAKEEGLAVVEERHIRFSRAMLFRRAS
jgi:SAM-dependent methyltransferase